MIAQATIHHHLDLVLRLLDSVTGRAIEESARFVTQSPSLAPIFRGSGTYLFLNRGEESFEAEIRVHGYEEQSIKIDFPLNQAQPPIKEVYLLPIDNPANNRILALRGNLLGIENVEAVSLTDVNCCIKEFDARKKIMTVLNQRNVRFEHVHYGLINKGKTAYEHFQVVSEINRQTVKCKERLESEYQINQPITRIIFGQTKSNGDYLIKVHNSDIANYLVRFMVEGKTYFQKVDFHNEESFLVCNEETLKKGD